MSFSSWLDSIGLVISRFISWIGYCFDYLKDNYIVLTFLGIAIFYFIFSILRNLINYITYGRLLNKVYSNRGSADVKLNKLEKHYLKKRGLN